jgi:hypothetical protein
MMNFHKNLVLLSALSTALITGCGGGGGASAPVAEATPVPIAELNAAAVFRYISDMFASTDENGEVANVNALTFAADDTSEPSALN